MKIVAKKSFHSRTRGRRLFLVEGYDERHEGSFVAEKAMDAIVSGVPGKEIAVLYRTNFQSRTIEEAMLAHNVPYTVLGVRFFERKEVRDLLAYLRAALNPKSNEDIKRSINTQHVALEKLHSQNYS